MLVLSYKKLRSYNPLGFWVLLIVIFICLVIALSLLGVGFNEVVNWKTDTCEVYNYTLKQVDCHEICQGTCYEICWDGYIDVCLIGNPNITMQLKIIDKDNQILDVLNDLNISYPINSSLLCYHNKGKIKKYENKKARIWYIVSGVCFLVLGLFFVFLPSTMPICFI